MSPLNYILQTLAFPIYFLKNMQYSPDSSVSSLYSVKNMKEGKNLSLSEESEKFRKKQQINGKF